MNVGEHCIINTHTDQLPVGLIAYQCSWQECINQGHELEYHSKLNFFQAFFMQLLKLHI